MSSSNGLTLKIVAHYPREDNPNKGTLHVLWVEGQIELRGCPYWLKDYRVYLPGHRVTNEDGKQIHYPAISFVSRHLQKAFQLQLRDCWRAYAKAKGMRFKQLSPSAPAQKQVASKQLGRTSTKQAKPGRRDPAPITSRVWSDPPRRPQW